ncbi:MAG: hypothetical protein AMXMBFR7_51060 [Planctomycetota bacterium]
MEYLIGFGCFVLVPAALATCLAASKGRVSWHGALAGALLSYLGLIWVAFWRPAQDAPAHLKVRRGRSLRQSAAQKDRQRRLAGGDPAEAPAPDGDDEDLADGRDPGRKSTTRALKPIRGREATPPAGSLGGRGSRRRF